MSFDQEQAIVADLREAKDLMHGAHRMLCHERPTSNLLPVITHAIEDLAEVLDALE